MENLKKNFESAAFAYLRAFCKKHDYDFDAAYWIGGHVGGVVDLGETMFVDMATIRVDMDMNSPVDEFEKWSEYCLRLGIAGVKSTPSFRNWINGCRKMSEEKIQEIEKLHAKVIEAKNILNEAIKKINNEN